MGYGFQEDARGIPFRSLRSIACGSGSNPQIVIHGVDLNSGRPFASLILPTQPIWPGFIANSVVYATFVYVAWRLLMYGFRWNRARRRLCPACAYDLRGAEHEACPECGEGIPLR